MVSSPSTPAPAEDSGERGPSPEALDAAVRLARLRRRMFGLVEHPTIGEFDVLCKLGEGGMGVVFAGWDPTLDRRVAIKLLRDPDRVRGTEVLRQEAIALAKLRHPNVVTIYAVGQHRGQVFIAMEYIEGETLRAWLSRWRTSDRRDVRALGRVFAQAARGLAAAHAAGLVHRDVKPENAMIDGDGRVCLTDFGLARSEGSTVAQASPSGHGGMEPVLATGLAGTPGYIAPKLLAGRPPSPASDQYAFVVCLHEALFGQRPPPIEALAPLRIPATSSVPRNLRELVRRGLSADPEARWSSMARVAEELERVALGYSWRGWAAAIVKSNAGGRAAG